MKSGHRGAFFTLEYNETDILNAFRAIGEEPGDFENKFAFDNSNTISAEYIIRHLETAPRRTIVVVDYLHGFVHPVWPTFDRLIWPTPSC